MAASTGIVVAAGALALLDNVLTDTSSRAPGNRVRIAVGTVGAALVSAGLDKAVPRLGTGAAVLLLVTVLMTSGPVIVQKMYPARTGMGSK